MPVSVEGSVTRTRTLKANRSGGEGPDEFLIQAKDPRDHESLTAAIDYAREVVQAKRKRGYEDAAQPNDTHTHGLPELAMLSDDSADFESPKKKKKSSHKKHKKHKHKDKEKKKKKHKDKDRDRDRDKERD